MSIKSVNHVERLLVYPGHDCPCCVGRFGFEQGLSALKNNHPGRTRREILKLNPLFIRQLPSARHQIVHVETIMKAMSDELPILFKKWRKHLQTYPEVPWLLHFLLGAQVDVSPSTRSGMFTACRKISPYGASRSPRLKKCWARPELMQEILRKVASVSNLPTRSGDSDCTYLPLLKGLFSQQLELLRKCSLCASSPPMTPVEWRDEQVLRESAVRYKPTMVESAYRDLAETILPAIADSIAADTSSDVRPRIQSLLSDYFEAGGTYQNCSFNISARMLAIDPELLLFLDGYRSKLNSTSISVLDSKLGEIAHSVAAREVDRAADNERKAAEQRQRLAEQAAKERKRQQTARERAAHALAVQEARRESLADMIDRFAGSDPVSRMTAIASQIAYAPAVFPEEWARYFPTESIEQLEGATRKSLIEKTRGVRRGEWKRLHRRLLLQEV